MLMLGLYFTFAAVQGDYGVFRRAEVSAEGASSSGSSPSSRPRSRGWRT